MFGLLGEVAEHNKSLTQEEYFHRGDFRHAGSSSGRIFTGGCTTWSSVLLGARKWTRKKKKEEYPRPRPSICEGNSSPARPERTLLHVVLETPLQVGIFPTAYAHFQDGKSLNENHTTHDVATVFLRCLIHMPVRNLTRISTRAPCACLVLPSMWR